MESSVAVKTTFTSAPMLGNKRCAYRVGLDGVSAPRPYDQDALRLGGMARPVTASPLKCRTQGSIQTSTGFPVDKSECQ
jgi:hypothetical protein